VRQLLQALAASLVAVPVYRWTRRMASAGWAIAAAAITLAAPALHYAGFLMTEPLILTVVTAALLALARAVEEPTLWRYGSFAGWATAAAAVRLQALVLLPAFLLAVALDALAARDRARLRPLLRLAALSALVAIAIGALVLVGDGELSAESALGAYTPVGESSGVDSERLLAVAWHAVDVAILGLAIPVLAIAALAYRVFTRTDDDPSLRAFVSVALAYVTLLVVQVGLFSAEYVGHVAERYLVTVVPLLAIGLCVWIARGAPRALVAVLPLWGLIVAGAALIPLSEIAAPETLVNTLTPAALIDLSNGQARAVLVAAALLAGALVAGVPRRYAWSAAAVVGIGLALVSFDSGRRVADASERETRVAMGSDPASWLDDAGGLDATLLATMTGSGHRPHARCSGPTRSRSPRRRCGAPFRRGAGVGSATTECCARRTGRRSVGRSSWPLDVRPRQEGRERQRTARPWTAAWRTDDPFISSGATTTAFRRRARAVLPRPGTLTSRSSARRAIPSRFASTGSRSRSWRLPRRVRSRIESRRRRTRTAPGRASSRSRTPATRARRLSPSPRSRRALDASQEAGRRARSEPRSHRARRRAPPRTRAAATGRPRARDAPRQRPRGLPRCRPG
jgi:hypothetical protein